MSNKKPRDKTRNIRKTVLADRGFLNRLGQGNAFCAVELDKDYYINETKKSCTIHSDASLTISDCSRIVELHFDLYSRKGRINALIKVTKLIQMITKLKKSLEQEIIDMDELKKKYPKGRDR